jgi:RNase P protein component
MNGRQRKQFPSELSTMMLLIAPFLALLFAWAGVMVFLLRRPSLPVDQEQGQTPVTNVEDLQTEVKELQAQLNSLQEADSRAFDLVLASLGSLVTVAAIVPAAATISKTISERNERNRIKDQIRSELQEEIRAIADYVLLHNYELSRFVANEAHVEDIKKLMEQGEKEQLSWDQLASKDFRENIRSKLGRLLSNPRELMQLEIHKYPLVLQDMSNVFHMHSKLRLTNHLKSDQLTPLVRKNVNNFLLLLWIMTCQNDQESDVTYVFPRLTPEQAKSFKEIFFGLRKYFEDEYSADDPILQEIDAIYSILTSEKINRKYYFGAT